MQEAHRVEAEFARVLAVLEYAAGPGPAQHASDQEARERPRDALDRPILDPQVPEAGGRQHETRRPGKPRRQTAKHDRA